MAFFFICPDFFLHTWLSIPVFNLCADANQFLSCNDIEGRAFIHLEFMNALFFEIRIKR